MDKINLPANLPENLEHDQIIAPNGSDIGQPEQYGYNYLMKQVNATQRALNELSAQLEDSETVSEAVADHNTSPIAHEDIREESSVLTDQLRVLEDAVFSSGIKDNLTAVFLSSIDSVELIEGNYNEQLQRIDCTKGVA